VFPRLLASNVLWANWSKHITLIIDSKASMIRTGSSIIITITLTRDDRLYLPTILLQDGGVILAVIFSILAINPPLHVSNTTNLFYFRSFFDLSETEFIPQLKSTLTDRNKRYDSCLHEICDLGKHHLNRKFGLIRNGL